MITLRGIARLPDSGFAIVTEYCNGGSLWELLESGTELSQNERLKIAHGVAEGMLHLEHEGVVHRDLAARNILFSDSLPKISDFGMSRTNSPLGNVTKSEVGPIKWMR